MDLEIIEMNRKCIEIIEIPVKSIRFYRNHSNFERSQLRDAGEFGNFETCYRYLLAEISRLAGT